MRHREESAEIEGLKTRFREWIHIVDLFANRRAARQKVDPVAYRELHKEIIEHCRAIAAPANEVDAVFFHYVRDLVRPWLTPTVLSRADSEILLDLLARSRQVERQLGLSSWRTQVARWALPVLIFSLVAFVGILALGVNNDFSHIALDRLHVWSDDAWIAIKRTSDIERASVVGIILIIVSIVTVSRTARN
jgi:hypothetical protein